MDLLQKGVTLLASAAPPIELRFSPDVAQLIAFSSVETLRVQSHIIARLFQ
jgi:hypothetical protein